MSRTLDVKLRAQDDDLLYRSLEVALTSTQSLRTPARAIDARLASRYREATPAEARLFEYYTRSGASTINDRMASKAKEQDFSYDLNSMRNATRGMPLILLQDFYETAFPSKRQLEFLIRTEHSYSDIVVFPLVSRLTDGLDAGPGFDRYMKFLKETMGVVDTYNKKPLMGIVPMKTPFLRIEELVDFYHGEGVNALCLDFASSKPSTARQSLEQVLYALAKRKALNHTYIHAINVSPGRPKRTSPVSPCHSILSFGFGADSFGDLHRPRLIIKDPSEGRDVPPRLFFRGDYGDHLVKSKPGLVGISPETTGFSLTDCLGNRDLTRLFNAEQHSLEAGGLPQYLEPGRGEPSVESYVSRKHYVEPDTLKQMKSLNASVRKQRRL